MKKPVTLALIAAFALGAMTSCDITGGEEGNDNGNDDGKSTETTAEFDNSNFGLYKGVIAGSSGVVRIEIHNGDDLSEATMVIDGLTDELMCEEEFANGEAIVEATFTGEISSFTFSVGADGRNPVISNIAIDGHDSVIGTVTKETSEHVSSCYLGTSIGGNDHRGTFNIVRVGNTYSGVSKGEDGFSCSFSGSINGDGSFSGNTGTVFNGLNVDLSYNGRFEGNGNGNVSGTWSNSWVTPDGTPGSNSGTFSGSRFNN